MTFTVIISGQQPIIGKEQKLHGAKTAKWAFQSATLIFFCFLKRLKVFIFSSNFANNVLFPFFLSFLNTCLGSKPTVHKCEEW